jgi:hypothetical protein
MNRAITHSHFIQICSRFSSICTINSGAGIGRAPIPLPPSMLAQTTLVQRILIIGLLSTMQIFPNFTRHNSFPWREAKSSSTIEHFSFIVEYWFVLV